MRSLASSVVGYWAKCTLSVTEALALLKTYLEIISMEGPQIVILKILPAVNTLHCCVTVQKGVCAGPEALSRLAVSIPPEAMARGPLVCVRREVHLELSTSCLHTGFKFIKAGSESQASLAPPGQALFTIAQLNYVSKNPKAMILQRDYSPAKETRPAHKIVKGMVSMHPL